MKGSRKLEAPNEYGNWLALRSEDWHPRYCDMPIEVKEALRAKLFDDQRGLCVYCGRRLSMERPGKSSHIEHFRPQRSYSQLDVVYSNLFLSCGQQDGNGLPATTCGTYKADRFDERNYVYPSYPDCTDRFRFLLTGQIVPSADDDNAADYMIGCLAIDHPELKKDREDVLALIDGGVLEIDDFYDPMTGMASSYAHVVYQRAGRELP